MKQRRIGLFGGSFDPPHNAHLALARQARDELQLDELKLVPAGRQPQKAGRRMASGADRAAMLRLLAAGEPRISVEEFELQGDRPSYTIDTVTALQAREPGAEWFLVLGQDQYARFHTWHRWEDLLRMVTLAVAGRAGDAPQPSAELAAVPHRMVPPAVAGYIDRAHLYRS